MPVTTLNAYLSHLEARQTETKMMLADVVMLPHVEADERKSKLNRWNKILDIHQSGKKARVASPAQLKLMGIGVNRVK